MPANINSEEAVKAFIDEISENKILQSTIATQADLIRQLREDTNYWYKFSDVEMSLFEGLCKQDVVDQSKSHTDLMKESEER